MTEENQKPAKEKQTIPGAAAPGVIPNRQPTNFIMNVDKLDEFIAYASAMREPLRYNTSAPFTVTPNSMKVIDLEKHMPHPRRVRKDVTFIDTASFNKYFSAFKAGYAPRMFALKKDSGLTVLCVFDYDKAGIENRSTDEKGTEIVGVTSPLPNWNTHTAKLELTFHPDYAELRANADTWFKQQDFAFFIEENAHLFVKPSSADMLEIAQDLKGSTNASWNFGQRLSNGQVSLQHTEVIEAKTSRGDLVVPETLELCSPIFEGFDAKNFKAAFRYKIEDKKVLLSYRLMTKLEEREGQAEVLKSVQEACGVDILNVSTFEGLIKGEQ